LAGFEILARLEISVPQELLESHVICILVVAQPEQKHSKFKQVLSLRNPANLL
jgi:hypothetical protein